MVGLSIFLVKISTEHGTRHRKKNAILSIIACSDVIQAGINAWICHIWKYMPPAHPRVFCRCVHSRKIHCDSEKPLIIYKVYLFLYMQTLIPVGIAKYMREKTGEKERREAKVYLLSCCCCWYFNVLQLFSKHSFSRKSPWQPSSWIFFHKSVFQLGKNPHPQFCPVTIGKNISVRSKCSSWISPSFHQATFSYGPLINSLCSSSQSFFRFLSCFGHQHGVTATGLPKPESMHQTVMTEQVLPPDTAYRWCPNYFYQIAMPSFRD